MLIDARKGVLTQTRRHSFILSLIGVKHVVLAINKIDLVDYDQTVFDAIEAEYRAFAETLGFETLVAIPVSALRATTSWRRAPHMPWYTRPAARAVSRDHRGRRRTARPSRCASRCSG